jgi:hypothetical protein
MAASSPGSARADDGVRAHQTEYSGELAIHRITFAPPPASAGNASGQALSSWLDTKRAAPRMVSATRRGGIMNTVQALCAVSADALALGLSNESIVIATGEWHIGSLAPLHPLGEPGGSLLGIGRFVVHKLIGGGRGAGGGNTPAAVQGDGYGDRAGPAVEMTPQSGVCQIVAIAVRARGAQLTALRALARLWAGAVGGCIGRRTWPDRSPRPSSHLRIPRLSDSSGPSVPLGTRLIMACGV